MDPEAPDPQTAAPCSVCGLPVPMLASEYQEMVALGAPVMHREHTTTTNVTPILKSYRAVVQVFEVHDDGSQELVAATTAKANAPTLQAAFADPLSTDLQGKWLAMAEKAAFADLPS